MLRGTSTFEHRIHRLLSCEYLSVEYLSVEYLSVEYLSVGARRKGLIDDILK